MKQDMIQLVIQKQAQKRSWKEDYQEKTPAGVQCENVNLVHIIPMYC